jgi:heme oxygenase
MNSRNRGRSVENRSLDVHEIRLVADLRIMHSKVDELFQVVENLKRRHDYTDIVSYADQQVLAEDIERVDAIYLWYVHLKEEAGRQASNRRKA